MKQLSLAFLWHLHQPLYRLRGERICFLPWARLHGIRSYYDMVRILEEFPEMRVTMNLVPTLIDQIRSYEAGASDLFRETARVPAEELDEVRRRFLFDHFFSAQEERMIRPLPRYADLLQRRARAMRIRGAAEGWREFEMAELRDLQALFDLAWFGFKAREDFPELRGLLRKGLAYTREDIGQIHEIEDAVLRRLVPLYRAAAERGQIEISTTPYAHPILPLLLDTESAREALPLVPLPARFRYPEDARTQVTDALDQVEREFGVRPAGIWPSEGSVSQETAEVLASCAVAWTASDDQVLAGSDREGPSDAGRVWEVDSSAPGLALLFRDHLLSDRIGFDYGRMRPEEAAGNFVAAAEERFRRNPADPGLVLIALDGENPWEHYPLAGERFLRALYGALLRTSSIACRTVTEAIAASPERGKIRHLKAGSWIHSDFGTWIGGPEKNRAWNVLGRTRSELASALREADIPEERRREAWASIRAAEGSDWFWWLDGQFSSLYRAQLDEAFRGHLRQAYEALGRPVPDFLSWPLPSLEPRQEGPALTELVVWLSPRIDGFEESFFEWEGAASFGWAALSPTSTLQRAERPLDSLRIGFSRSGEFLLRIDAGPQGAKPSFAGAGLHLSFRTGDHTRQLRVQLDESGNLRCATVSGPTAQGAAEGNPGRPSSTAAAARKILELAVPCEEVGLRQGERAALLVTLRTEEGEFPLREIDLRVPSFFSRLRIWSVM